MSARCRTFLCINRTYICVYLVPLNFYRCFLCVLAGFQAPAVRRDGHAQPVWQRREQRVCRAGRWAGPGARSQLRRGLRCVRDGERTHVKKERGEQQRKAQMLNRGRVVAGWWMWIINLESLHSLATWGSTTSCKHWLIMAGCQQTGCSSTADTDR